MNYYQSSKVKAAMRTFISDMRKMRAIAINRGVQTKLSYETGANARTYKMYYGNSSQGTIDTQAWEPLSGTMGAPSKDLDSVINFPADSGSTPQTFTELDTAATKGDPGFDIVFLPDGSVRMPINGGTGQTRSYGSVTIKTPLTKVSVQAYEIQVSPVGRITSVAR
jgi:hypothetical protein